MKKTNRYRHTPDLAADLIAALITIMLIGSVTLSSLYIYTWWRPHGPIARAVGIQSPVSSSEVAP